MKSSAIGIDVGGTTVKIGLFHTENGAIIDKWEIPTRRENGGEKILPDIAASIKEKMKEYSVEPDEVEGAGVGVPGAVLKSTIVNRCVNLGWGVVNVGEELSGLLYGVPVKVGNDANVAALGEMWKGGGMGFTNLVMVTLGTGVGGGIILDGKIIEGTFGAAGEIGHIMVNPHETEVCNCGKRGCLEQYASATGIARLARKKLAETDIPSILRNIENPTAKDIFDAAKDGDGLAKDLVEQLGRILGRALSFVSSVVDPEVFVIGGGVSKAGDILIDVIEKYYRQDAFHASRETKFALATLGNDAGIYGAVKMIL